MKFSTIILNTSLYMFLTLFVLDNLHFFDIKSEIVKYLIYYGIPILVLILIVWNLVLIKNKIKKFFSVLVPIIVLILALFVEPLFYLDAMSPWKTQEILYRNTHNSNRTIEYQMRNLGPFGYKDRKVEVYSIFDLFMIIQSYDSNNIDSEEWKRVNEFVNEMNLKY